MFRRFKIFLCPFKVVLHHCDAKSCMSRLSVVWHLALCRKLVNARSEPSILKTQLIATGRGICLLWLFDFKFKAWEVSSFFFVEVIEDSEIPPLSLSLAQTHTHTMNGCSLRWFGLLLQKFHCADMFNYNYPVVFPNFPWKTLIVIVHIQLQICIHWLCPIRERPWNDAEFIWCHILKDIHQVVVLCELLDLFWELSRNILHQVVMYELWVWFLGTSVEHF